jgi:hypothetical protein
VPHTRSAARRCRSIPSRNLRSCAFFLCSISKRVVFYNLFAIHITIISDVAANIDIVYLNFFIPVSFAYYARSEDIQVFASGYIYDAVRILFYDLFENADNSCNVVIVNCFALKIDFETMF